MAIDRTGISSLDTGASDITYSGNEGPKSPDQQLMASADPMLVEEYDKYVFQMEEQGLPPISFKEFVEQVMAESRMAEGGIARLGYIHGGITHPDGRRGFFMGAEKDARESGKSMSPGTRADYSPGQGHRETYGAPPGITTTPTHVPKPPEDKDDGDNWLKKQLEARAKTAYNLVPNKFSWTYDKRKRFIASLSDPEKRALGYNFNVDWDDLDDEEKDRLMSYDVYRDLNEAGYQGWLDKDYEEKFGKPGGGKGGQTLPYYPPDVHPGTGGITDATDATGTTSDWNVASLDQPFDRSTPDHDFSGIYAADGGRIPAAYGGIMGDDGRRAYGLGSIFKKAKRAIKKVAKSPIGKAAMLYFAPMLFGKGAGLSGYQSLFGVGSLNPLKRTITSKALNKSWTTPSSFATMLSKIGLADPHTGALTTKGILSGIGGASALGGLYTAMNPEDEDEDEGYQKWLAEKNRWLGQIGDFPVNPVDPLYQRDLMAADGGRIGYAKGGDDEEGHRSAALSAMYGLRKNAQEGGLMDLGGMEKDYREEGGFVPIGGQERADDVPARLSKNEFVFTADAVRAAGGGDIDAGAEVMENVMNNLEQGGNISEESQGLEGARDMFATSQRLEGVM